ncbi:MAG: GGDEF domain-containing protein [Armatimonadetes bacterium]|nr:GGDEF domain-containing protein [Armatimonadota bacterium]
MKTVRDIMSQDIVTIHPASTVKTAVVLMKGHQIGALPVVNGEALIGLVQRADLLGCDPSIAVEEVMQRDFVTVAPDTPVHKAADKMAESGVTRLLVEEEGSLAGIVTHTDIIPELGKSFDPLTALPWSDTLREWARARLHAGEEISVIFFDIDLFGKFNKKYGHIMGDSVLKALTSVLKGLEDSSRDMLCRMGGDEFVIATMRTHAESRELAEIAQQAVSRLHVEGLEEELSISFGVSGGRRTREREDTHYAATIDDLLNRASRECTRMKQDKRRAEEESAATAKAAGSQAGLPVEATGASAPAQTAPPARFELKEIGYSSAGSQASFHVTLTRGEDVYRHQLSGLGTLRSSLRLAADVCAGAVQQALPEGHHVAVEDVSEFTLPDKSVVIIATALLASAREILPCYGVAVVRRNDTHRAAAASVLAALNRPISRIF